MVGEKQIQVVLNILADSYGCPRCGTRLRFGDQDCPHCGHDLDDHLRMWAEYVLETLENED